MATGPPDAHHEAGDTGKEWGAESQAGEAKARLYHDAEEDIRRSFTGPKYTSSTAQQRPTSGYTQRETRRLQKFDWSDEAIVSPFQNTLNVLIQPPRRPSSFALHAGFCQLPTLIVLLQFLSFSVIHFYS